MHFNAKKFFLVGFFLILLIGIPLSVYFLGLQTVFQPKAEKATKYLFAPASSSSNPIQKEVGDEVALDVMVDPGTNLVQVVKMEITYDPDKLATASSNAFKENTAVFSSIQEGPVYEDGKIIVSMSTGFDPTKAIQTTVKAATLTFKTLEETDTGNPTRIDFSSNSLAYSQGSGDQALEQVFAGGVYAAIAIGAGNEPTATDTPEPTDEPEPTDTPEPTDEPEPADTTTGGGGSNDNPICATLVADKNSGRAPLAVNFTANGTDADGTISKATFNFGDGQVSDVTTGGGIGSDSVNVQLAHTYSTVGTFQTSVILTDDSGGVSSTSSCSQTISVSGEATVIPTVAPSGTTEVLFGAGIVSLLLIIGGGLLFLVL